VQVGILLHGGERLGLQETDARRMAAMIRRDQPWVENFVPKIGDHERDLAPPAPAAVSRAALATVDAPATATVSAVNLIDAEDELSVRGRNYAVIKVLDMARAQRVYHDLLGLELYQRLRQDAQGVWEELGDNYDEFSASQASDEADVAFMHNGPLNVALAAAGRSAVLDYGTVRNQMRPPGCGPLS
jgi:hypothetical protein